MCGIFGWIGAGPESPGNLVERVSRVLAHRGPDDQGFQSGRGWGLGFRRLSILDLSPLGHQQMSSPDGRYWLIFNGEIYNYLELRESLERAGEKFKSTSVSEVLLIMLARARSTQRDVCAGVHGYGTPDFCWRGIGSVSSRCTIPIKMDCALLQNSKRCSPGKMRRVISTVTRRWIFLR